MQPSIKNKMSMFLNGKLLKTYYNKLSFKIIVKGSIFSATDYGMSLEDISQASFFKLLAKILKIGDDGRMLAKETA